MSCNQFCPLLISDHVQEHAILCDRKNAHYFTQTSSSSDADKLTNHEGRLHRTLHAKPDRWHSSRSNKMGSLSSNLVNASEMMKQSASVPVWTIESPDAELQFMQVCG